MRVMCIDRPEPLYAPGSSPRAQMARTQLIQNPHLLRHFSKPDFNLPRRGWKMEAHELSPGIVLAK